MNLGLQIQRDQPDALYRQIAEQIIEQITTQRLPVGTRLPTIRQLSQTLGVTRVTIQNAYDELQASGWIESTVGRGTYVSALAPRSPGLPNFAQSLTPDAMISDILQINEVPGVCSLASASPDPALFPVDEFWAALGSVRNQGASYIGYSSSQGVPGLRVVIAEFLQEQAINVAPDQILITAGITQGLALVTQALCRAGDTVLVEQPTYVGLLHTLKMQGVQPIGVPITEGGPALDQLERLIVQHRPRFFYLIPSFQNPTGNCLTVEQRREFLALAQRYGLPLVEDDIYAALAYDQPPPPSLKALDTAGLVVHIGSFSKTLMPGLRLAYVLAPPALQARMLSLRRGTDLCSPPLLQLALAAFVQQGSFKKHLRRVLPIYRERRDALLAALQRHMPAAATWTRPAGGYCCWLTLPPQPTLQHLAQAAVQHGWIFTPGDVFLTEPAVQHHLRICFGHQPPAVIGRGIRVLSQLIRARLEQVERLPADTGEWAPLV